MWGKKDKIKRQEFTKEIADEQVEEEPIPKFKARPPYEGEEEEERKEDYYKPEEQERYVSRKSMSTPIQKKTWELTEISTQSAMAIVNNKTQKVYDIHSALVELLNRTE